MENQAEHDIETRVMHGATLSLVELIVLLAVVVVAAVVVVVVVVARSSTPKLLASLRFPLNQADFSTTGTYC